MTPRILFSLACATLALAPIAARADAPIAGAAPATVKPNAVDNVQGRISIIDTAAKTITVTSRHGAGTSIFAWNDGTKVYKTSPGMLTDVKVGDTIRAYGAATPEAPTLTASHLLIVPAATLPGHKKDAKAGFHHNRVDGVVASTTPTLTLTTAGGVTVTVNTTADTKVEQETEASASDLSTGENVQAHLEKNAASPTAMTINILPPRSRRTAAK